MSKTRASCFIRGSRHLETIEALGLQPRAFICFSVSGTPDETRSTSFWHITWKLYFGQFLPYLQFSLNWPLSSKSLLWTAPLCHIIWLVHITMAHLRHFESFRQCAIFVDSFSRQSFTLGVISKWKLSALKLAIMAYFFSCIGYMSGIFFSSV